MNIFSFRYCVGALAFLMDEKDKGGGGGGGDDLAKKFEAMEAANKALLERLDKLEKSKGKKGKADDEDDSGDDDEDADDDQDDDLSDKARKAREKKEKATADTAQLERAIKFNVSSKEWIKNNASLLPKDIEGIFTAADKEKYDSEVQKADNIMSSIIQTFFQQQSNLELLTAGQKSDLDDYLKLTKDGKQEKAQSVYRQIFEPSLEMLRRIKKAESLNQSGGKNETDVDAAYKDRLIKGSRKHYLGEKENA